MVKKGNLLYNGDFETGTTEGWICGAFGLGCLAPLSVTSDDVYRGNYAGRISASEANAFSYVAYDVTCSFEEYEAYLYIFYGKLGLGACSMGVLYGLDDNGNLIKTFALGYNKEKDVWIKYAALLRGFDDITHFQIGVLALGDSMGVGFLFDEAKLIPLKSIKSHTLADYKAFADVSSNMTWYSGLACIGNCRLRSIVRTSDVSGTDPSLTVKLYISLLDNVNTRYVLQHSTITGEETDEQIIDLPEVALIEVEYIIEGTSPSFDIFHHLRIEPDKSVETAGGGAL